MTDEKLYKFLERYTEINENIRKYIAKVNSIINSNEYSKKNECYDEIEKIVDLALEGSIDSKDEIFDAKTKLFELIQKCNWTNDTKKISYYLSQLERCSEIASHCSKTYVDPYTKPERKKELAEVLKKKF